MKGKYALLLNTDAQLTDEAISVLLDFMNARPDVGMACGQLVDPDGSKQNSVASFPTILSLLINESVLKRVLPQRYPNSKRKITTPIPVDTCIGACIIVRKEIVDELSGFDERYFFFFEETDMARRIWQSGWKVFFIPTAKIIHDQGQSAGHGARSRILFYRSRYQYFKKWYPRLFFLSVAIVWLRLVINAIINGLGALITLGFKRSIRNRFLRNFHVIAWHLLDHNALKQLDKPDQCRALK